MAHTATDLIGKLEEALRYAGGTHTLEDVFDQWNRGECQVWWDDDAVIVTEVKDTPQKRVVHFWLAGGEMEAVLALSDRVLAWARREGCTRATLAGRKGWERVLRGWTPEVVLMGREV